jgi:hypothetical protein
LAASIHLLSALASPTFDRRRKLLLPAVRFAAVFVGALVDGDNGTGFFRFEHWQGLREVRLSKSKSAKIGPLLP